MRKTIQKIKLQIQNSKNYLLNFFCFVFFFLFQETKISEQGSCRWTCSWIIFPIYKIPTKHFTRVDFSNTQNKNWESPFIGGCIFHFFFFDFFFFFFQTETNFLLQRNGDTVFKRGISNILLVLEERRFSFGLKFFYFAQEETLRPVLGQRFQSWSSTLKLRGWVLILGCWAVDTRLVIGVLRIELIKNQFYEQNWVQLFFQVLGEYHLLFTKPLKKQDSHSVFFFCRPTTVDDGSHNVSRWMTWLPISLKNAAKCDKWYQLQNLSITESLNANGAWKKILVVQLQACHDLSVEQKPRKKKHLFFQADSVLECFLAFYS